MEVAKKYQENLPRIKKNVEDAYFSFQHNYRYWHRMKRFIYVSTLDEQQKQALAQLKKPELEFNISEAFISRLRGEFFKNEPNIEVSYQGGDNERRIVDIIEGHIRYLEYESRKNGTANEIFDDMLSGGFSVAKVCTDWENEKSFNQVVKYHRVRDPTMCGFDPLARTRSKQDGQYCFEICPKTENDLKIEYPEVDLAKASYSKTLSGFAWSKKSSKNENIILVCDYYERKRKKVKLVRISTGQVMTNEGYKNFKVAWADAGVIEQVPVIIDQRYSEIDEIVRYRFIENQVLEFEKTDYKFLPYVFFDGNSVTYRDGDMGPTVQVTRSLIHNAVGVQRLKDFAGQTQAAELENMIQHKFIAPVEAIPENYLDAWKNPQDADVLLYNQFWKNDPNNRIDPPREIARPDIPQSVMVTFTAADQMIQNILGSYDATIGINKKDISGRAIEMGAMQSNAASMPYFSGYIDGLNQVANLFLDLIPKYSVTPANIPIISRKRESTFVPINDNNTKSFAGISQDNIHVKVEAGANFSVQRNMAVRCLVDLVQMSPEISSFIVAKCLPILFDNLDFRGADQLPELFREHQEEIRAAQEQQAKLAQQQQMMDPMVIAAQTDRMRLEVNARQNDVKNAQKMAGLVLENEKVETEKLKTLSKIESDRIDDRVKIKKAENDRIAKIIDLASKRTKDIQQTELTE